MVKNVKMFDGNNLANLSIFFNDFVNNKIHFILQIINLYKCKIKKNNHLKLYIFPPFMNQFSRFDLHLGQLYTYYT